MLGGIIETDVHAWVDGSGKQSAVVVRSAHLTAESSVGYRGGCSSGLVRRAFSCGDRLYVTEREEILMFPLVDAHVEFLPLALQCLVSQLLSHLANCQVIK